MTGVAVPVSVASAQDAANGRAPAVKEIQLAQNWQLGEGLFGRMRERRWERRQRRPEVRNYRRRYDDYYDDEDGRYQSQPKQQASSGYATYCVRTCDGYYFPISHSTSRGNFSNDAHECNARCSGDARLFYERASDDEMSNAVDLQGRSYSALPNAFRYRQKYDSACKCHAEPWSRTALERHARAYHNKTAQKQLAAMQLDAIQSAAHITPGENKVATNRPTPAQSDAAATPTAN